jgi:hypothetical protein
MFALMKLALATPGDHRSRISRHSARDGRRMAEIGGQSSTLFQTPANTNEVNAGRPFIFLVLASRGQLHWLFAVMLGDFISKLTD